MIALLQRVREARVEIAGKTVAAIGEGLLVLVGIERGDAEAQADRLLERLIGYRVFNDDQGKMNLSVLETGGSVLIVPQFTLAADTRKGTRPSFTPAARPDRGRELFQYVVSRARGQPIEVRAGQYGAHMQVYLVNDGPVTFWLHAKPQ